MENLKGKLFAIAPSANNLPSISTGSSNVGKAPLALIASGKNPFSNTFWFPVSKSVAIQKKGIGNFEKSSIWFTCCVNSANKLNTFCHLERAVGKPTLPLMIGKESAYFSVFSF